MRPVPPRSYLSVVTPKADICSANRHVRFTPESVLPCFHFRFYRIRLLAYVLAYKLAGEKFGCEVALALGTHGAWPSAGQAGRTSDDF
jgi:hypothetical protein